MSGVVVATDYLTGDLAARARRMTEAFESYNQLRVLKRPMTGLHLSIFLMVTLLMLFGATWTGSYLAKRITRPVQMLAAAAREIGAGRLDQRIEPQSHDEFGALTEAFNCHGERAGDEPPAAWTAPRSNSRESTSRSKIAAATSRRFSSASPPAWCLGRRRRCGDDDLQRRVPAARSRPAASAGSRRTPSSTGRTSSRSAPGSGSRGGPSAEAAVQEITIQRDGRELHLVAVATALVGDHGERPRAW